ncbi:site-specific integrase [uncultured Roseobacter sp.]|uniref:tyrosine-type recombinase/integrase n=1 Tax=uncultured Roseobacter sp. TaxID=114847 RepID=UPI00260EDC8D|nr:site-specific integrase [uncultured Roseobacter sp.]
MPEELTERRLASIKKNTPDEGRTEYSDSKRPGLRLRVSYTGRMSWLYERRVKGGTKRRHTLGAYPAIGLSEARSMALEIEAEAAKGIDRVAIAAAHKLAKVSQVTVQQAIDVYDELHLSNLRRGDERKRQLETALADHLTKAIDDLTRKDMQAPIDAKAQEGKIPFANRIKAALSAFSKWAWRRGYTETDEGAGLIKAGLEEARERTPTIAEVRQIYQTSFELGKLWGPFIRLLVFTLQRRSEILGLVRSEIDLTKAQIVIPGSKTKNGKPHITHLSAPALDEVKALIAKLDKDAGPDALLFTTTETTPLSGVSKAKRRLDNLLGDEFEHWTLHDLRTGFSTAMAESGVPESVADRVLNHVASGSAPSAVARVYNKALMLPQRAAALDRWAEMVTGKAARVVALGNVN